MGANKGVAIVNIHRDSRLTQRRRHRRHGHSRYLSEQPCEHVRACRYSGNMTHVRCMTMREPSRTTRSRNALSPINKEHMYRVTCSAIPRESSRRDEGSYTRESLWGNVLARCEKIGAAPSVDRETPHVNMHIRQLC